MTMQTLGNIAIGLVIVVLGWRSFNAGRGKEMKCQFCGRSPDRQTEDKP